MCIDEVKVFANNEKELDTQIETIRICSKDIRMEFGIEKCAILIRTNRKKRKSGRNRTVRIRKELEYSVQMKTTST